MTGPWPGDPSGSRRTVPVFCHELLRVDPGATATRTGPATPSGLDASGLGASGLGGSGLDASCLAICASALAALGSWSPECFFASWASSRSRQ